MDFDFAEYLAILTGSITADLVEIPVSTLCFFFLCLGIAWIYLVPVHADGDDHFDTVFVVQVVLTVIAGALWALALKIKLRVEPDVFHFATKKSKSPAIKMWRKTEQQSQDVVGDSEDEEKDHRHKKCRLPSEAELVVVVNQHSDDDDDTPRSSFPKKNERSMYLCRESGQPYALESTRAQEATTRDPRTMFPFQRPELMLWMIRLVMLLQAVCVGYALHRVSTCGRNFCGR